MRFHFPWSQINAKKPIKCNFFGTGKDSGTQNLGCIKIWLTITASRKVNFSKQFSWNYKLPHSQKFLLIFWIFVKSQIVVVIDQNRNFYIHPFQYIPCHTLLKQYTNYPTSTCGYGMTNLYTDLLFIRNILSNNATSTSHS